MSKIISTHQPNYIPWLGYFYKIYKSNVFVFYDDTQFVESGMHNYHYIKTPQGAFRLKIPVQFERGCKIMEVRTKDELNWKAKQLRNIEINYKRARHFKDIYFDFSNLLNREYSNLAIQNVEIIKFICEKFGIKRKFVLSSSLNLKTKREEKIIDTCKALGGDVHYSGIGAKAYQMEENFTANGIKLVYSDFKPFSYFQRWGAFQSNVTVLDYLMYYGYDWERVLEMQKEKR